MKRKINSTVNKSRKRVLESVDASREIAELFVQLGEAHPQLETHCADIGQRAMAIHQDLRALALDIEKTLTFTHRQPGR